MQPKNKTIYAAFCGTGKSYLCNKFPDVFAEVECWKYRNGNFPSNYIDEILSLVDKYKYVLISTDPAVLAELYKLGFNITIVYPNKKLKEEYFCRYTARGSSSDFINTLNYYWDIWLIELDNQENYKKIVLDDGIFLQDVLN